MPLPHFKNSHAAQCYSAVYMVCQDCCNHKVFNNRDECGICGSKNVNNVLVTDPNWLFNLDKKYLRIMKLKRVLNE